MEEAAEKLIVESLGLNQADSVVGGRVWTVEGVDVGVMGRLRGHVACGD